MHNYSVLRLILAFLPIIQHFQDAAYYSKNYSSIINSGLLGAHAQARYTVVCVCVCVCVCTLLQLLKDQ